jgi:membrane-associated phospholipid phosphatase
MQPRRIWIPHRKLILKLNEGLTTMRVAKLISAGIVLTIWGMSYTSPGFAQLRYDFTTASQRHIRLTLPSHSEKVPSAPGIRFIAKNKFRLLALTVGTAFFASQVDAPMDEEYARETHGFPATLVKSYGKIGSFYDSQGTYYCIGGLASTALAYGLLFHDKKVVKTVGLMIGAYATSSLITTTMKIVIGRDRPYVNHGPAIFHPFKFSSKASQHSFPSGHTTTIFAMTTVLAKQYPQLWVSIPAYTLATSVAFQRMLYRKHWASDVIVGGAIGYWVGKTLVKKHGGRSNKFSVQPSVSVSQLGLSVDF